MRRKKTPAAAEGSVRRAVQQATERHRSLSKLIAEAEQEVRAFLQEYEREGRSPRKLASRQ